MSLGVGITMLAALPLPCGAAPLIDGRLDKIEWIGSSEAAVGGARLLAKTDAANLYVGVRLPRQSYRYVDLYVQDGSGRMLNLHASMQQGERVLTGAWTDTEPAFAWKPAGWRSSIARRTGASNEAPIAEQLQPLDGYEMEVPLAHLGPAPHRLRVEVRDFVGEAADWAFPARSTRKPATWARIPQPRCR